MDGDMGDMTSPLTSSSTIDGMEKTLSDLTVRQHQQKSAAAFEDYILWRWGGKSTHELPISPHHDLIRKATVTALVPGGGDPLLEVSAQYARLVEEGTVIGQLPGVQAVAPNTALVAVGDDDAIGDWVADGAPIPASDLSVPDRAVSPAKMAAIFTASRRLLESPDARAARALKAALVRGMRRTEDTRFLSTDAAVAATRPAGILSAALAVSEGSPEGLETAIELMFSHVSNGKPVAPAFIVSPRGALWLSLQHHSDGGARFPNARVTGGDIAAASRCSCRRPRAIA